MFAILSAIASFLGQIAKFLIILALAVVFVGFLNWAIPNLLGFQDFLPVPLKIFIPAFIVVGVCKVVLKR